MIRHPFQGHIRPFRDDPNRKVEVIWYPILPNSPHFPWPIAFGNPIYNDRIFKPHVGVPFSFHPGRLPLCPGFVATGFCGTQEQWQQGCLTTDPVCESVSAIVGPIQEVPGGVVDGINLVFNLTARNYSNATVVVYVNGVAQQQGVDYHVAVNTITFVDGAQPRVGNRIWVTYWSC